MGDGKGNRCGRRGVVVLMVIALLAICLTLFGLWARQIVDEQRRLASQQNRLQAVWLAEAGVRRARVRRAADPKFEGETWQLPSDALGGAHNGEVRIRVLRADESGAVRCEAVAEYPAGVVRHVQITKQMKIQQSSLGNE